MLLHHFKRYLHVRVSDTAEDRAVRYERSGFRRSDGDRRWRAGDRNGLVEADFRDGEAVNALGADERQVNRLPLL